MELKEVGKINLSTMTMCGDVKNCYISETGYVVDANISTFSGSIKIS